MEWGNLFIRQESLYLKPFFKEILESINLSIKF